MATSIIVIVFLLVALLYSSVGFGGGSTYIALLLIANLPIIEVRYIALICNIVVVSTACYAYYKEETVDFKVMIYIRNLQKPATQIGTGYMAGIGGGIGLLSGLIGIGGGIFLAPILHLINWKEAKAISAAASFFILFNSISGLVGQSLHRPSIDIPLCVMLAVSVFVGGRIGNRLNIHILPAHIIRLLTAILVGSVGLRLIYLQMM